MTADGGKKVTDYLMFSISQVTRFPISFWRGPTFSQVFPVVTKIPIEAFVVALDVLGQI